MCIPLMHQIVALSIKFLLSLQKGSQGLFCFLQPNDGVLCPQQHLVELYIENPVNSYQMPLQKLESAPDLLSF